ncbi:sigma factor G inhibitor Gin [Paenibacillus sp. 481]|uniref:sigma factor G inhibitor Gin n=1 Tax=Paenibacillus sp. 481 TaxID=2835869 RepID=UPI001E47D8DD|nr:sigma factor G inhibitor Gin [Paenibacillus sp. 481]UHA75357.1 sigma factor G inhibitor Gin [Paenibacillus sp. 481]
MESTQCCIVCNNATTDGIVVVNQFICTSCEQEMVRTDVEDEKYNYFIHQLKRLWVHMHV